MLKTKKGITHKIIEDIHVNDITIPLGTVIRYYPYYAQADEIYTFTKIGTDTWRTLDGNNMDYEAVINTLREFDEWVVLQ